VQSAEYLKISRYNWFKAPGAMLTYGAPCATSALTRYHQGTPELIKLFQHAKHDVAHSDCYKVLFLCNRRYTNVHKKTEVNVVISNILMRHLLSVKA